MKLPRPDRVQISSDAAALLLTAVALGLIFSAKINSWVETPVSSAANSSIEVSLQTETAVTPPAPPPPVPQKTLPHRVVVQHFQVAEIPIPAEPQFSAQESVPEGAVLVAAASSAAAASISRPDLEAEYAASLRADIDRRTRPPDSIPYRLRHPSGEVRVGFVVMRSGEAKAIRVLHSSGSSMLDAAALDTVSSGHYPPMPAQIFAGEAEHLFAVTIEYRPAG